jgi:preprotein translocase subunit SecD
MKLDLKWRGILITAVILLAIFYIGPSLTNNLPSFWKKYSRKINLGLDLRGGTHLLLRVKAEDAVRNTITHVAGDLRDLLVGEKIRFVKIEATGDRTLEILLLKPEQEGELLELLNQHYPDFELVSTQPDDGRLRVMLQLSAKEAERIKESAVNQSLETIRNRLDPQGVKELDVVAQGVDRILIQLPGVEDVEHAKEMIKKVALLEFKIVDTQNSLEEALKGNVPKASEIRYTSRVDPTTGRRSRGDPILLKKQTLLTGDMLDRASVQFDQFGTPRIAISFDAKGAKLFDKVAEANVGNQLAIVLDGTVYSHPVIKQRHYGGNAVIEGNFSLEEARDLVVVLKAGSLPAPVEIEEERTVGPSLGRDSIRWGLISMVVGMFGVVLFMAIYYRMAGVVADLVLLLNVLLIMSAMASLRATLTLPGIAGIILTIGMAVDANVLIFERVREELRAGKSFRTALDAGYSRAFLTIVDANVTTLIAGAVLFQFGTGPIRGFAVTLCIGIVASLFTAVLVSRTIFDFFLIRRRVARISV